MHSFGGQRYTWSGFRNARAVFRIIVERVDILIAIHFHLHSNVTVQMARLGASLPFNERTLTHDVHSSSSNAHLNHTPSSPRGVRLTNVEILI